MQFRAMTAREMLLLHYTRTIFFYFLYAHMLYYCDVARRNVDNDIARK